MKVLWDKCCVRQESAEGALGVHRRGLNPAWKVGVVRLSAKTAG